MSEADYKIQFAKKYFEFDKNNNCKFEVNKIDIILKDKKNKPLLYIESKESIQNKADLRKARAQIILTNKNQKQIFSQVALIYKDKAKNDILELIKCDDSVMFNNDFNWSKERASTPSKDAIDRINDRLIDKISTYKNDEIKEFYQGFIKGESQIHISLKNVISIFKEWKNSVKFEREIEDEQDLINLFLVDMLDEKRYKKDFAKGEVLDFGEVLIHEGTDLNNYAYSYNKDGTIDAIKYSDKDRKKFELYPLKSPQEYKDFWSKYKRPPSEAEFMKILEYSARLYTENYRKATGGEYTPSGFVSLQNEVLKKHYDLNEFLVFDPCAGVGNLENQFGKSFKECCYLSTLEQMDVDTCKIKGFLNSVKFDYLKDDKEPLFLHNGKERTISEICKLENKKLMVIMNPPYRIKKGFKYDLAIEFFNKVVKLKPQVIVLYCKTEFFFRDTIEPFIKSGYKILEHNFSNAKTTFRLSEWSISQIIFDKDKGEDINKDKITASRYETTSKDLESARLHFIKSYTYDFSRPSLLDEIDKEIEYNQKGMILGQYSKLNSVLIVSNGGKTKPAKITTKNLKYCLLSKGMNINSHAKYFEWAYLVFRGRVDEISQELFSDCVAFSLFYKGNLFSNKTQSTTQGGGGGLKNYIMPFTHEQLGCAKGELNVLEAQDLKEVDLFTVLENEALNEPNFDFREFLKEFHFSSEAKALFKAALELFKYYHANPAYENKNFNDSFYDITNAIMGKNPSEFKEYETQKDTRIAKVKTTKGTLGFSLKNLKSVVNSKDMPLFEAFFKARDTLARKINKELLEANLLLWERENIY